MRVFLIAGVLAVLTCSLGFGDDPPAKRGVVSIRQGTKFSHTASQSYSGVVVSIDKEALTLRWLDRRKGEEQESTFHALDLHKAGKIQEWADGATSYRWQDVKKGDTIDLKVQKDETDGKVYALDFIIRRRPGEKLPIAQKPKHDSRWYSDSFLNDIDNGEDKTEQEIVERFPPLFDHRTHGMIKPTTFPPEYRTKISDIRDKKNAEKEKKEQELKATPPKTGDKK